jgi:hypothetical protein
MRPSRPLSAALLTLSLISSSWASVTCKKDGSDVPMGDGYADFTYSPRGVHGAETGKMSHFRLMTIGNKKGGAKFDLELKTVDVTGPGAYPFSTETTWRSVVKPEGGKRQRVKEGRFVFTRFEMNEARGQAVGTLEYTTEQGDRGVCSFNVEVVGVNIDRLKGL